ncbi:MAG: hypothetical protein WAZ98_02150 [Cyclobacteriaceae bacterium]
MRSTLPALTFLIIATWTLTNCNNIGDADPSMRETFIKFYEGSYSMSASSVEITQNGFVILGNMLVKRLDTTFSQTIMIETDNNGNRIGEIHDFPGGTGKSFKALTDGAGVLTGYIVVGDSIYTNPQEPQAANVIVSSMSILIVDSEFENSRYLYITDRLPISNGHPIKDDYYGGTINLTDNGVIILGTFKEGVPNQQAAPAQQLLFGLDSNLDSVWFMKYPLLGNTFSNSRSIHYKNGKIVWAASVQEIQNNFISSYVTIPFVGEQSTYENNSPIGQGELKYYSANDIQPAYSPAFGYGIVGTYSEEIDGSNSNLFFAKVDHSGNIVNESDLYFDGIESFKGGFSPLTDKSLSSIVDGGEALTSTQDGGFVLAGTFTTNPEKGNGARDLFLVKLNKSSQVVWMKTFGGSGDETPVAIRETSNGDLLVCGTNTLGDFASIFLMKMDKNGELKN